MKDFTNEILSELEKVIGKENIQTLVRRTDVTEDAVKVTHIPTGIEVVCEEYNSQVKNKAICLAKLFQLLQDKT